MFITNFMKAIYLGHVYMSFFIIFERELRKITCRQITQRVTILYRIYENASMLQ